MASSFVEIPRRLIKRSNMFFGPKPMKPRLHPEVTEWLAANHIKVRFHCATGKLWFANESQAMRFKLNMGRWDHIQDIFSIEKITVQAQSRVLRGSYTWAWDTPTVIDLHEPDDGDGNQ
jgi:hypothetical protein